MATQRQKREKRKIVYSSAKERAEKHESGFSRTAYSVPDGMEQFQIKKAGTYKLDIIPFVAGKGNPFAEEGSVHYERTFYQHGGIGAEQKPYTCPARTFGKKCPICEEAMKLRRGDDPEAAKDIRTSERQLFLVIDHADAEKGVQLWEISHFAFGAALDEKIKSSDDEDGYENFFHLDDGMYLKVTFKEDSGGKFKFLKCTNIEMRARSKPLPDSLLDEVPCLDDLIILTPYDKLKSIYLMEEGDEDGDEPKASRNGKKVAKKKPAAREEEEEPEEPEEEETQTADEAGITVGCRVDHADLGECVVARISKDGTSLTLEDEAGDTHKAVAVNECELLEEEEEEPPARKKPGPKAGTRRKKPDDDDEEPEEEEEEDPDDDDQGDDDEEAFEEEEEPEEKPAPRKKPGRK